MEILEGLAGLRQLPPGTVVSIGNYDGMHRGHARLIEAGRRLRAEEADRRLALVTFEPHPLTVLRPEAAPPRLTPFPLKESLACRAGVDYLVILPPAPEVLNLTADEFWRLLRDEVRPSWLVEGDPFNFGKGRGGTLQKLREWSADSPVRLEVVDPVQVALTDLSVVRVSSSLVRWLVGQGRVRDAAICLGRPYQLQGQVIEGFRRGRTLGMPTANLQCGEQLLPADGVYAGRCRVGAGTYPVALSVGTMPTFGENRRQVEAHLLDFDGDLYGRPLSVDVLDWIRDQRKFSGVEELKRHMARDLETVRSLQIVDPARPIAAAELSEAKG